MAGELSKLMLVKMWRQGKGINTDWLMSNQPMLTKEMAAKKLAKYVASGHLVPDGDSYSFRIIKRTNVKGK